MASISSLSGSTSATSIYGNRNIISGLASGLDTETLIENAVSGYKTKIQGLQQKQTQVQWKQDAYRSILDKMINMNRKYTSYTSNTNLFSQSFFNKAVKNSVMGANASAVSATGRTNSNVSINSIKQLATSAKYTADVSASDVLSGLTGVLSGDVMTTTGVETFDLTKDFDVGSLKGGLSLTYGDNSVYLSFSEKDVYKTAEEMAEGIREKLSDAMVRTGSGEYVKASDRIGVSVDSSGNISFSDKTSAGNSVYISSADKTIMSQLGIAETGKDTKSFRVNPSKVYHTEDAATYLSGKTMDVTLNGKKKTIDFEGLKTDVDKAYDEWLNEQSKTGGLLDPAQTPALTDAEKERIMTAGRNDIVKDQFQKRLQSELDDAFGAGRITAKLEDVGGKSQLSFDAKKGDTLAITSDASTALGLGDSGLTSYVNTSMKLRDIFTGDNAFRNMTKDDVDSKLIASSKDALKNDSSKKYYLDTDGKTLLDKDGATVTKPKELTINGQKFEFDDSTTLESMINRINGSEDAGVTINYSKLSNQFTITSKDTGSNSGIEMSGELAKIFGHVDNTDSDMKMQMTAANYVGGQDAIFNVTVNGETMDMTRDTNEIDFDGMTVTLKNTFGGTRQEPVMVQEVDATTGKALYNKDGTPKLTELKDNDGNVVMQEVKGSDDPITFKSEADADKIIEAIQSFVDDYNAMVKEIREQYATQPAEKSSTNHTRYMPLTDDDKEGMSESAIAAYEEKAKQGILFGETELSSLHNALRNAITGISSDINVSYTDSAEFNRMMKDIGLTTSYSSGLTTLSLDVEKLRSAIENDPDKVRDTFTQTVENGAKTDGLMQRFQKVMTQYANTSSGSPGILVQRAGSQYAPNSVNNNALQDLYDSYTEQIEKIQEKMSDRIDYYTRQFTALEQLMSQMNSQSSALAGLMGGSSSY